MRFSRFSLLVLAFSTSAGATPPFKVSRSSGQIFLEATPCSRAQQIFESLQKWKTKLGEPTPTTGQETQVAIPGGGCKINITGRIPSFVEKYNGIYTKDDWGNCFGTVCGAAGFVPDFIDTHVALDYVSMWFDSPLCKKLSSSQKPEPGDVVVLRGGGHEIHGMMYAGPEMVFSKNSAASNSPFALQTFAEAMKKFDFPETLKASQALNSGSNFGGTVDFYHCMTMKQFRSANADIFSGCNRDGERYSDYGNKMDTYEKKSADRAIHGGAGTFDEFLSQQIRPGVNPIIKEANDEIGLIQAKKLKAKPDTPEYNRLAKEEFLWQTLAFRAMAALAQM